MGQHAFCKTFESIGLSSPFKLREAIFRCYGTLVPDHRPDGLRRGGLTDWTPDDRFRGVLAQCVVNGY